MIQLLKILVIMRVHWFVLFLILLSLPLYGGEAPTVASPGRGMLPMLRNGSPAAYVLFSPLKQTNGLAMINPEGSGYTLKTAQGFQGVMPAEDSRDQCLYFQTASDQIVLATGTFYVTIQYLDRGKGAVRIDYNGVDKEGKPQSRSERFFLGDSGYWLQHTFTLTDAALNHAFPAETDFRIYCPGVPIRSVSITRFPTPNADQAISPAFRQSGVNLPAGYSVGVIVEDRPVDSMWESDSILEGKAKLYHTWGAPFVVTTVDLSELETPQGKVDFSRYAARAKKLAQWNLGWVPRFKIGDLQALPPKAAAGLQRAVGTEKSREGPMASIWDPQLPQVYGRLFSEMRLAINVPPIPRVILSFAGDWGPLYWSAEDSEQAGWPDFWAGDARAVADFQAAMRRRYGSPTALRAAWHTNINGWQDAVPVLSSDLTPSRKLDTLTWYRNTLAAVVRQIVEQARIQFPQAEILIETGGDFLYGATDARLLAAIAAETKSALLMITEETLPATSVYWLWLAGAANRMGVKCGLRYTGRGSGEAVLGCLFSLASEGGTQFYFPEELLAGQNAWQNYTNAIGRLTVSRPQPRVGVVFPRTSLSVESPQTFARLVSEYREYFGFDVIDEEDLPSITAAGYPLLFVPWGTLWTDRAITAFENLVRGGAALIVHAEQPWTALSGDAAFNERLFAARLIQTGGSLRYEPLRDTSPLTNVTGAPAHHSGVLTLGMPGDEAFLSGQWGLPQDEAAARQYGLPFSSFRWLGERGRVSFIIQPGQDYRLDIEGFLPRGKRAQVLINRQPFGTIEGDGHFVWSQVLRGAWRPRQREMEITLRGQEWSTGEILGATQTHRVTMAVSRIGLVPMKESAAMNTAGAPATPPVPSIDRPLLRGTLLREIGRGFTLLAPGDQINDYVFREILNAVVANPALLDPRYRFTIPLDGAPNRVYLKPLLGSTVYVNLSSEPVTVGGARAGSRGLTIPPQTLMYSR